MKPRVLYVTHRVPFPPDRGDRIRTWNILKYLASRADVDLACLADEPLDESTLAMLRRTARRVAVIPHTGPRRYARGLVSMLRGRTITEGLFDNSTLRRTIQAWNQDAHYNAAIASSSGVASYVLPPALAASRVWVDLIDVDSQKWLDYSKASSWPMSAIYRREGQRLRNLETHLATQVDRMLVVTAAECELFKSFCKTNIIQAVGNGVDTDYFAPSNTHTKRFSCVFVGVMDYRPNVDAVRWFVKQVWPTLKSRYPQATFTIVGKSPAPEVTALEDVDGVTVTGAVDDVRPWLHESNCVVVPLRIARGVQNKVLEAMACGRPIVCSSAPLQGLNVEPGLQLLCADEVNEWVDSVAYVFNDEQRAQELGMAANAWVQMNHRWEACLEPMADLLDRHSLPAEPGIEVTS